MTQNGTGTGVLLTFGTLWPWVEDFPSLPPLDTRIDVETLRDGLRRTQPVRHASGTDALERRHIDAR